MGSGRLTVRSIVGSLTLLAASAVAAPADAAVLVVTKTADTDDGVCDADCSLREAVDEANSNGVPDTIMLPPGTVTLTDSVGFATVEDVTLQGAPSTIRQTAADRVINVDIGTALTIVDVTVTGGDVSGTGGGVRSSESLTVISSRIVGNTATGAGGGIESFGDLVVRSSVISGNTSGFAGGGISADSQSFSMSDSIVTNNQASDNGGGIEHGSADGNITSSVISGNASGNDGGGIHNDETLSITGSRIESNLGGDFGGGVSNIGSLTMSSSTISDNQSDESGAGLFNAFTAAVDTSTIAGNRGESGAGIYALGGLSLNDSTVSGNAAEENGGGLVNVTGITRVESSTITANRAGTLAGGSDGGGGGFSRAGGTLTFQGSIISGNFDDEVVTNDAPNCFGSNTTLGGNVFGPAACEFEPSLGDVEEGDPELAPLAFNGGPTQTHAFLLNALPHPAIDRDDSDTDCVGTDQRGAQRPTGENCDSGSYELVFCDDTPANVIGTASRDILHGTNGRDGVLAGGGNDKVFGHGGNDDICGQGGDDKLLGGDGNDVLRGGGGTNDRCIGNDGVDAFRTCEVVRQ